MNEHVTVTETQGFSDLSGSPKSRIIGNTPNCNGCLGSKSMTLEERLETWIEAYCLEENPQPRRVAKLRDLQLNKPPSILQ